MSRNDPFRLRKDAIVCLYEPSFFVILHSAKKPFNLTKRPMLGLSEPPLSVTRFCQPEQCERKLAFRRIKVHSHQQSPNQT